MVQYKRIGEMLCERGLITEKQLANALKARASSNLRFGEILVGLGLASEDAITECLADQYGYEIADLNGVEPEPQALALVPSVMALSGLLLPVKLSETSLECIISDPLDLPLTDQIFRMAGRPVSFKLAAPTPLFELIGKAYGVETAKRKSHNEPVIAVKPAVKASAKASHATRRTRIDPQDDMQALVGALRFLNSQS